MTVPCIHALPHLYVLSGLLGGIQRAYLRKNAFSSNASIIPTMNKACMFRKQDTKQWHVYERPVRQAGVKKVGIGALGAQTINY